MTELERLNEALKEAFAKIGITKKTDMAAYIPYRFSYFSEVTTGHKPMSRQEVQAFFEELKKQLAEKDEQLSKRDAQIDRLLQIIENLSGN